MGKIYKPGPERTTIAVPYQPVQAGFGVLPKRKRPPVAPFKLKLRLRGVRANG